MGRYKRYDWRLRNLVARQGHANGLAHLSIPKSTIRDWIAKGPIEVITLQDFELERDDLIQEVTLAKQRISELQATSSLVTKTFRIFGLQIQYARLPSAEAKSELLESIKSAVAAISPSTYLEAIGLSLTRYRHWLNRERKCELLDQPSCPRTVPSRLTATEILSIKRMFSDSRLSHYSVTSLSYLGKRTGEVFASTSTWLRTIKSLGLKRLRQRVYPPKPKIGIRASAPNQLWHLDQSIIRLGDHSRVFIQAIIDNFSRYVLSWHVSFDYGGARTKTLIEQALAKAKDLGHLNVPTVMVDSGCENINQDVNQLITGNKIRRVIAQIEITASNSMIEMLFHRLKNRHLYFLPLNSLRSLEEAVDFYLNDSNQNIPHATLRGAKPHEVYTGIAIETVKAKIEKSRIQALKERIETNRNLRCLPCPG